MGLFSNTLKASESLFRDELALDYDYLPKLLPYREKEQHFLANCIKPLLMKRPGKNLVIYGVPGIGKTAATNFVLRDLEDETESVIPLYVNCWNANTSFKVFTQLCEDLNFKFIQNKKTDELFHILKDKLNKSSAVLVFDEIDKAEDLDFLYTLLEGIHRKSIFLLTNHKDWIVSLDQRIKSRLTPEMVEFKEYNQEEMYGILKERASLAFSPGVMEPDVLKLAAKKAYSIGDVRSGLFLLRESALTAENASKKKVEAEDMKKAMEKLDAFSVKKTEELNPEDKFVLEIVRQQSGEKIGDLFKSYEKDGGKLSYKTFQRTITKLNNGGFVKKETIMGGSDGTTTIVTINDVSKKEEKSVFDDFASADSIDKDEPKEESQSELGKF